MNLVTAARHDSVSNECDTSMFTTLVVRQKNREYHLFKAGRRNLTSTPVKVSGNTTHHHQVALGLDLQSVDKLDRRFCADIWLISIWFSLTLFLIQWTITLVGVYFSCTQCLRVSCQDELSPIEVVQQDVLLSILLNVLHCNQDLNVSVDFSLKSFNLLL